MPSEVVGRRGFGRAARTGECAAFGASSRLGSSLR